MISRITCIGTKVGKSSLELMEALTISDTDRVKILDELKNSLRLSELVYIATCNRVEFVMLQGEPAEDSSTLRNHLLDFFFQKQPADAAVGFEPDSFRIFSGRDAVQHLFNVASSLDSIVIGEAQILGQVKEAHRFCQESNLSGAVLDRLFAAAYKTAKQVRTETELGKKPVSMASLVGARVAEILETKSDAVIAIVGSGPMTPKLADIIRKKSGSPILFVNRTLSKVEPFADRFQGRAMTLEQFLNGREKVDILISSTSSPEPIFTAAGLRGLMRDSGKLYAFDLAMPRDFSADLHDSDSLELWNLERLNQLSQKNRRERFRVVDQANRLIAEQVRLFLQKEFTQMISPLFDSALGESMTMAEEGLSNLFKSRLSHLSETDQQVLLYWSRKVLAHACFLPARQLAEKMADADPENGLKLSLFARNIQ